MDFGASVMTRDHEEESMKQYKDAVETALSIYNEY